MGICFEVKARRERGRLDGQMDGVSSNVARDLTGRCANDLQAGGGRVGGSSETDDEGGTRVEHEGTENTPLLNGSRKSSGNPGGN